MTYNVYASPWNGTAEQINFVTPIYSTNVNPISIPTFAGTNKGTIYICVRQVLNGLEDKNFNYIAVVIE